MNYINWMKKNYIDSDCPKGDLARDIKRDENFPKNRTGKFDGWRRLILSYLYRQEACDGCLAAFEESWKEYVECEKRRLNRTSSRK